MSQNVSLTAQSDARTVLAAIKQLRTFEGDEQAFWQAFGMASALLSQSMITRIWQCNSEQTSSVFEYHTASVETLPDESVWRNLCAEHFERIVEFGVVQARPSVSIAGLKSPLVVFSRLEHPSESSHWVVMTLLDVQVPQHVADTMVRLQLISDVPKAYLLTQTQAKQQAQDNLQGTGQAQPLFAEVLAIQSNVFAQSNFKACSLALVNEISARFGCDQVSLAWHDGAHMAIQSISHVEKVEQATDAIELLESLSDECAQQGVEQIWPKAAEDRHVYAVMERYVRQYGLAHAATLPIEIDGEVKGVLIVENHSNELTQTCLRTLRLLLSQLSPWLHEQYLDNLGMYSKAKFRTKSFLHTLKTPQHTSRKCLALFTLFLIGYLFLGQWTHKVEAPANLQTDNVAYISTPFDGFVDDVFVASGDVVEADQALVQLDTKQLYLEEAEAHADVIKFAREAEKARAVRKIADMRIAQAKQQQAQTQLDRVQYYLDKARLTAPFSGIVVEGEKEKLMGAPVNKGDLIFKLAHLSDLYLTLQLDERDIEHIRVGQKGELALLSKPDSLIQFEVTQIIPMSQSGSGQSNTFELKAKLLDNSESWWRPGMSGLAKVEVGERSVFWVLTHKLQDFLNLFFWW